MDFLKSFGKNIANYRKLRGLTQEQLAEKMNLSLTTIAELELGKNFIKAHNLTKLVEVLNIEYKDLFDFGKTPEGTSLNIIVALAKTLTVDKQKHIIDIIKTFINRTN